VLSKADYYPIFWKLLKKYSSLMLSKRRNYQIFWRTGSVDDLELKNTMKNDVFEPF
jgi:hypothetical protein